MPPKKGGTYAPPRFFDPAAFLVEHGKSRRPAKDAGLRYRLAQEG